MSTYKAKINPFTGELQLVVDANLLKIRGTVNAPANLPLSGNAENDCYIVKSNDRLYTWNSASSSGTIDKWVDIGASASVDWSAIINKPSSTPADIDDAVSKRHTQGTDQGLDTGGSNAVMVADIKDAVTKKHTRNTDTKLDEGGYNEISASQIQSLQDDIIENAFKIAILGDYTEFDMISKTIDEYIDQSGIDLVNSTDIFYNTLEECYQPLNDFSGTSLLLHCDGDDESTLFIDETGKTVTSYGNAEIKTDKSKFGGASGRFHGTGDYLTVPASSDFNIGNGANFTVDFWVNFAELSGYQYLMELSNGTTVDFNISYAHVAPQKMSVNIQIGGVFVTSFYSATQITNTNTWYHIALVRNGDLLRFYINGIQNNEVDLTGISFPDLSSLPLYIGNDITGNYCTKGWIDEFRWSNSARWLSDFTPPTSQYVGITANMTLLSKAKVLTTAPNTIRLIHRFQAIDAITLNTDLIAEVSRDNGTTWTAVTLTELNSFNDDSVIVAGSANVSSQPSGTNLRYRVRSLNNKNFKLHGTARLWA
jgi:hypothetical protein